MSTSVFQIPKNTGFTYGAPKVQAIGQNSAMNKARGLFNQTIDTVKSVASPNMGQYAMYFFSILLVLFAILMFINYFITPIWQLNPGGPGIIPLPGLSDAKVYWTNVKDEQPINDASGGFGSITKNWSMSLDIFVSEPYLQDSTPRILFARCPKGAISLKPSLLITDSVLDYNVVIAILGGTNDLVVSVLNVDNIAENITIPNIPIQKPFRIGVIIFDSMMEVYVNGMLYRTLQFNATTKAVNGYFQALPSNNINKSAAVKNLILWTRTISAGEMRYAKPSLAQASEFDPSSMESGTSSCVANAFNASNIVSETSKSLNSIFNKK